MTAFSLRLTNGANAVSKLHADDRQRDVAGHRARTGSCAITNGVHPPTWVGGPIRELFERYLDADLDDLDGATTRRRWWERIERIPAAELWEAHLRQKRELAVFARGRLRTQFARHGEAPRTLAGARRGARPEGPDDRLRPPVRDVQARRDDLHRHASGSPACSATRTGRSSSSSPARPIPPTGRARR